MVPLLYLREEKEIFGLRPIFKQWHPEMGRMFSITNGRGQRERVQLRRIILDPTTRFTKRKDFPLLAGENIIESLS